MTLISHSCKRSLTTITLRLKSLNDILKKKMKWSIVLSQELIITILIWKSYPNYLVGTCKIDTVKKFTTY